MAHGHGYEVERYGMAGEPRVSAGIDWARIGANVSGPLLTMSLAIALDLLTRAGLLIQAPFPILFLALVFTALRGGLRPALISALLVVLYAVHFLSREGEGILSYGPEAARSLVLVAIAAPAIAVLVARARPADAAVGAPRREPAERRARTLAEVAGLLAGSLEYETTLQGALRRAVPDLADWAVLHLLDERGQVTYAASYHRDTAREAMLHPLRRYPPRELHGAWRAEGAAAEPVLVADVGPDELRGLAHDEEHLKQLQALAPVSHLLVPVVVRGRAIGSLLLGTAESERRFADTDVLGAMQLASVIALAVDTARHRRAADEAENRYRLLFENNPQPMWVFDVESLAFLAVNDAAVRHYGYGRDEFLSMTLMDIRPPDDVVSSRSPGGERSGRDQVAITQHQRKDGSIVDVEIVSHELPASIRRTRLVQVTDVTDRTRTKAALHQSEEQLRQAQKMDAVGRLAGGIAHDFNNLLTTIQGYSEILLRDLDESDARRRDVEEVRRAADRGALLTRQLLAFGQRQRLQPVALDLNDIVRRMETLVQRLVGADINVAFVLTPGLGRVHVDPAQIEQVIVNLVLNARDAMAQGGTLAIETAERHIGPSGRSRQLRPGRYLVLTVSDTGTGMDAETQAHLFQPFFTTKDPARRSGLGLSIVYGIVKQSGGVVRVSSEPGAGTAVKIYLPMLEESSEASADVAPESLRGLETVLLVEDEDAVRELLRKVLARQGYSVLEARHGRDALMVLERHRAPVQLVVTDLVMPEMGGRELADHLRELRPSARVLFISGYTNDEIVRRGLAESEIAFIQKPFSSDDFLRKVREVLDAPEAEGAVREA
jgi:PAS domain S-box-containing protein